MTQLADCILENLKCPRCSPRSIPGAEALTALSQPEPAFAASQTLDLAIVGGKRRGTMEYQAIARRYRRAGYQFIRGSRKTPSFASSRVLSPLLVYLWPPRSSDATADFSLTIARERESERESSVEVDFDTLDSWKRFAASGPRSLESDRTERRNTSRTRIPRTALPSPL